jgi:hypothetical protein
VQELPVAGQDYLGYARHTLPRVSTAGPMIESRNTRAFSVYDEAIEARSDGILISGQPPVGEGYGSADSVGLEISSTVSPAAG